MKRILAPLFLLIACTVRAGTPIELKPDSPHLHVTGLGWYSEDAPILHRLPLRLKSTVTDAVWSLAQHPSGARIRFRTDSTHLTWPRRIPTLRRCTT